MTNVHDILHSSAVSVLPEMREVAHNVATMPRIARHVTTDRVIEHGLNVLEALRAYAADCSLCSDLADQFSGLVAGMRKSRDAALEEMN